METEEKQEEVTPKPRPRGLTKLQASILEVYKNYHQKHGAPPSNVEIAELVRCHHVTVSRALSKLESMGLLVTGPDGVCKRLNEIINDAKAQGVFVLRPIEGGAFHGIRRFEVVDGAVTVI